MSSNYESLPTQRFRGPHTGFVAAVFVSIFIASLLPVSPLGGTPAFPFPTANAAQISDFFLRRSSSALLCAFLQFGSAIPLGIFTATISSQLSFLGVRAAGTQITLFGGFLTAVNIMSAAAMQWAMTYPEVAREGGLIQAIYRIGFAFGGPGFSVSFGILLAGIAVTAGFYRLIPKWLAVAGVIIALIGELGWFEILSPRLLPLIPLTRFPGFVWMIAVGFALPRRHNVKRD
jgi:hypothetical protein